MAVRRAILDHPDLPVALDDLRLDLADLFIDKRRNLAIAADDRLARLDHAVRAKLNPSVAESRASALVFCHDFKIGLSDHFGMNDGFGLNWLTDLMALNAPFATYVSPFSKCFIGLIKYPSPTK